ncbi:MAG: hypothetical protein HGA36_02850 [Candidatus Moranbacteria bacterium]|nr:hypothetical protein [Candidatus Moranbacteria bacterium]
MLPNLSSAAPSVISPTPVNVSDGQDITISGLAFGTGPNVALFDDFESGNVGQTLKIGSGSASLGQWDGFDGGLNLQYNDVYKRNGNKSLWIDNTTNDGGARSNLATTNLETFFSFWAYVPSDKWWPGANSETDWGMANWKIAWLKDDNNSNAGSSDLYFPAYLGHTGPPTYLTAVVSGNNAPLDASYNNPIIKRGEWFNLSGWVKGRTDGTGEIKLSEMTASAGIVKQVDLNSVNTIQAADATHTAAPYYFNTFILNGFARTGANDAVYFDDVYVATGVNAQARVEIGNAATYSSSTNLTILPTTSWSANSITTKVRQGSFPNGQAYLYVTDASGNVNTTGYSINFVPTIATVSGTIGDGQSVTIAGSGFGATGPEVLFFDNFENGTVGQNINTGAGSATIGEWNLLGVVSPKYTDLFSQSGSKAFMATSDPLVEGNDNGLILLPSITELAVSFWVMVPAGDNVPGEDGGIPNWKVTWFDTDKTWGTPYQYAGDDDVVVPALLGLNNWYPTTGNMSPYQPAEYTTGPNVPFLTKGQWKRVWYWFKGGSNLDGAFKFWKLDNGGVNAVIGQDNVTTMLAGNHWNYMSINAYTRQPLSSSPLQRQLFDDLYIATGSSAQARVEIGNAATYATSTNLTLATVNSWSDVAVSATVRQGSFTNGQTAYLYVFDKDGNVNAMGFPVTFGSAVGDVTPPSAPSGLSVL